jgi:hypothetical protein
MVRFLSIIYGIIPINNYEATHQSTGGEALVPDDPFNPLLYMRGLGVCFDIVVTQPDTQMLYIRLAQAEHRSSVIDGVIHCYSNAA